jgi:hypothetical protein
MEFLLLIGGTFVIPILDAALMVTLAAVLPEPATSLGQMWFAVALIVAGITAWLGGMHLWMTFVLNHFKWPR